MSGVLNGNNLFLYLLINNLANYKSIETFQYLMESVVIAFLLTSCLLLFYAKTVYNTYICSCPRPKYVESLLHLSPSFMETIERLCQDSAHYCYSGSMKINIKAIQLSPVKIRQIFPRHCSANARRAHELSDPGDGSHHKFVYSDISTSRSSYFLLSPRVFPFCPETVPAASGGFVNFFFSIFLFLHSSILVHWVLFYFNSFSPP